MASSSCQLCAGLGCANCGGTGQIQIPDETDPGQWVFLADDEIITENLSAHDVHYRGDMPGLVGIDDYIAALGYVKLGDDEIVVKRKTAETAIKALASVAEIPADMTTVPPSPPDWRVGCDDEIGAICDMTAALDASGGKT